MGGGKSNLENASFGRKKRIEGIVIGTIVGGVIFGGFGVTAVTLNAEQIKYTPSNSEFNVNTAQDALNELYALTSKIGNISNFSVVGYKSVANTVTSSIVEKDTYILVHAGYPSPDILPTIETNSNCTLISEDTVTTINTDNGYTYYALYKLYKVNETQEVTFTGLDKTGWNVVNLY